MTRIPAAVLALCLAAQAHAVEWNTAESRERWSALKDAAFGPQALVLPAQGRVRLEVPEVAQDAALVPVTVATAPDVRASELDLFVDENPSPLAARITFGPSGDGRKIALRLRVNAFTNMHAIVRSEGRLFGTVAFVQGAGGCSAPMGTAAQASTGMGEMRMTFGADPALDNAPQATLMIRHPNFNGMQMDQTTRAFTPARYVKAIDVSRGDASVFAMTTDISLASNPVIRFLYRKDGKGAFKVVVTDTAGGIWTQRFEPTGATD